MNGLLKVVKIGGNVVDSPEELARFVREFASLEGPKILVHGGGKEASRLSTRLEIPVTMIEGRRVTSRETLDVVTMVYAGLVNKRVSSLLQAAGCDAVGLCGADGNALRADMRPKTPIDYGYVGDIPVSGVNTEFISSLLAAGKTPVFCAITHDGCGTLLNCNADSVASAIALGMARVRPVRLIYCFEQPGVIADINRPDSVIAEITPAAYTTLKENGTVSGGMIPKIENALAAVAAGVESVSIRMASALNDPDAGTTIRT